MRLAAVLGFTIVSLSSCAPPSARQPPPPKDDLAIEDGKRGDANKPVAVDPCAPSQLGLGSARMVRPWAAPKECTASSGATEPTAITSEAEFATRFNCPAGKTSGVDFATLQLVIQDRSLSPAGAGTTIVDDGARVTFIERQRSPCPGDPQPMPMTYTLGFLLPTGAQRTYETRACTLPPACGK